MTIIASLLAIGLGQTLAGEEQAAPSDTPPPSQKVQILLQTGYGKGVRLSIPQDLLDTRWRDGGVKDSAPLDVHFPDLQPPPPRRTLRQALQGLDQHAQSSDQAAGHSMEAILKEWAKDTPSGDGKVPLHHLGYIWLHPGVGDGFERQIGRIRSNPEYVDPSEPDFRHYRYSMNDGTVLREYLIPIRELEARWIWLDCFPGDRSRLCVVHRMVGDRLDVQYTIPRKDASLWRDLDAKVDTMVRQFVVDCFEGPVLERGDQPATTHPCSF